MYPIFVTTAAGDATSNCLLSAAYFMTLAVTLWTTVLIAYRIYSRSSLILDRKKSPFYNILETIIQSSFIYSVALVPNALLGVIPEKVSNVYTLIPAENYLNVILFAIAVCGTILHHND